LAQNIMIVWSLRFAARHAIVAITALVAVFAPDFAEAQGRLDARYAATLGGLPIGRGAWVINIGEDRYTAAAHGATSGVLRVFTSGQGTSAAHGAIAGGQPFAARYSSSVTTDRKTEEIRMTLSAATIRDVTIDPPSPPSPERVPLTDAHRRGVSDPMTAALMRVVGTDDPVAPEACSRKLSIFDGRMRFDLQMAFKRMEQVRANKGYQGRAVVCAVYFSPIAGYIPDRYAIKYLIEQRGIEAWLVPIAGTRLLVPFRVVVPTPLGLGVLQATQFLSVAGPQRANGAKTQ
jgi:hypothetical protein